MAIVKQLKKASTKEIVGRNNRTLANNFIPVGYPKYEISKGYNEAVELPIELESYKVEKLTNI